MVVHQYLRKYVLKHRRWGISPDGIEQTILRFKGYGEFSKQCESVLPIRPSRRHLRWTLRDQKSVMTIVADYENLKETITNIDPNHLDYYGFYRQNSNKQTY